MSDRSIKDDMKEVIENRPTRDERKQRNEEYRAKRAAKKAGNSVFPRKKWGIAVMIVLLLVAVAFIASIILVGALPENITLALTGIMLLMLIITSVLLGRKKKWMRMAGILVAVIFVGVFGFSTYALGTTYVTLSRISAGSDGEGTIRKDVSSEPFNVYITGIDQWAKEKGLDLERSDVNMIVTVNPVTKKVLLTSIPRDAYVKLHTAQQMDKLTHTGIYGVDETINTVEDWTGVELDYYVKMNFSAVRDVVDAMGGIDVYSPVAFSSSLKPEYTYEKGWNHLNGHHALYFARERHAFEGQDSIRVENQQRVVKAIIKKMTSSTTLLTKYGSIMDAAGNNLTTDMSDAEMKLLVKMQLADFGEWDIETQKMEGEYGMDYVASMSSKRQYSVYYVDSTSLRKCVENIKAVMNPTAAEEKAAGEERVKNVLKSKVNDVSGEEEEETADE